MNSKKTSIENKRHTLAHLLAAAIEELYPNSFITVGPVIENGFYYDIDFTKPISDKDLKKIEKRMKKLVNTWEKMTHKVVSVEEAKELFKHNKYKLELISDIEKKGQKITLYTAGKFTDLCRGGHCTEPKKELNMEAFKLTKIAGAYWRGDEKNKMITRIYGCAFDTKQELDEYIKLLEIAKERDHRKLGKELDLFVNSKTIGSGLPLLTEKGATIRRILERFIVDEEISRGYKHVYTQDITKVDLYKKSGHYPYYKDSMYPPMEIDGEEFILRPMTCPHHFELYLNKPHSYKDLPLRYAEIAKLYRYEQSGELSGLMRVRSFNLADAHIFCTGPQQAGEEISKALDLIDFIAQKFGLEMGLDYSYRLSLGDRENENKYYKDDASWDESEEILREILKNRNCEFKEEKDEAGFYGPKIDVQMKNVVGKEDTAFTVQYDFVMPKRFELNFKDENGEKKECVVVHRSSIGAIERIMAFLIEKYAGAFPLWLSPIQVVIIPVSDKFNTYGQKIKDTLTQKGFRVELNNDSETLGKRIRKAQKEKVPYMLVVGQKEEETSSVALRSRENGDEGVLKLAEFIKKIQRENE